MKILIPSLINIFILSLSSNALAVQFVAHRGANDLAPENSVEAMQFAWNSGAKIVEADFYVTLENKIVCIHGPKEILSLTGVEKSPENLTQHDLDTLNLANNQKWKNKFHHVKIPLLSDILKTIPKYGTIFVEIKKFNPNFPELFEKERLASGLSKNQIVFISFKPDAIKNLNDKLQGYKSFLLISLKKDKNQKISPSPEIAIQNAKKINATGLNIGNTKILTQDYISTVKNAGLELATWGSKSHDDVSFLQKLNVDYISTDSIQNYTKQPSEN